MIELSVKEFDYVYGGRCNCFCKKAHNVSIMSIVKVYVGVLKSEQVCSIKCSTSMFFKTGYFWEMDRCEPVNIIGCTLI